MSLLKKYSLAEIGQCMKEEKYPISGITELGSAEFQFQEPVNHLGVALYNLLLTKEYLVRTKV